MIIASHVLYCFPLGSVVLVWVFLPVAVFVPALMILLQSGEAALPFAVLCELLFFVAIGPIFVRTLEDTFQGFFAGLFAVFGQKRSAQAFLALTQKELDEWERQYA